MNTPPQMAWLTPYLTVSDALASLTFYERAFGFQRGEVMRGEDGRVMHCEMLYRGYLVVMFAPAGAFGSVSVSPVASGGLSPGCFYLFCDDVEKAYADAVAEGALSLTGPEDRFWGHRVAVVADPDGYQWALAAPSDRGGAASG